MRYALLELDPDAGTSRAIAELDGDDALRLTLVSIEPDRADWVCDLVERLNGEEHVNVEAPPPAGAKPHATYSRRVARGDAGFLDALNSWLSKYHDLRLEPVAESS